MPTNTVRLHRVLRAKPTKVYRAFTEAEAMARWLPPNGFTCTIEHMDARVGGTYKMAFRNFTTGNGHSFGGTYLELVPGERIRYTDQFDDPNLPGEMVTSVTLRDCSLDSSEEAANELVINDTKVHRLDLATGQCVALPRLLTVLQVRMTPQNQMLAVTFGALTQLDRNTGEVVILSK